MYIIFLHILKIFNPEINLKLIYAAFKNSVPASPKTLKHFTKKNNLLHYLKQ